MEQLRPPALHRFGCQRHLHGPARLRSSAAISKPSRPGQQASSCSNTFPRRNEQTPSPLVASTFPIWPFSDVNRLKDPPATSLSNQWINGGPVPTSDNRRPQRCCGWRAALQEWLAVGGVGVAGMATPRQISPRKSSPTPTRMRMSRCRTARLCSCGTHPGFTCHDRRRFRLPYVCKFTSLPTTASPGQHRRELQRLSTQRRAGANHLSNACPRRRKQGN